MRPFPRLATLYTTTIRFIGKILVMNFAVAYFAQRNAIRYTKSLCFVFSPTKDMVGMQVMGFAALGASIIVF